MNGHGTKRILVVCQHFWPEEFRINDICRSWAEMGYGVDVLCAIPNYPRGAFYPGYGLFSRREEMRDGISIYRAAVIPRGSGHPVQVTLNYMSFPVGSRFAVRKLLDNRYDSIFVYQLSPVFMAIPALWFRKGEGTKTFIYIQDLWPESLYSVYPYRWKPYRRLFDAVSHAVYRKFDRFLTPSRGIRRIVQERYGADEEHVLYLPNWAEELYEERRSNPELRSAYAGAFTVMFAGNIGPAQSFDTMLEAAALLRSEGIGPIRWVIVGDGMSKAYVEERTRQLGLADIVEFPGRKPMAMMPEYYDAADCLLVSLVRSELFGMTIPTKIQSYLASGKPIVASLDGEGASIVTESGAGFACESENPKALAAIVRSMRDLSEEERQAMGRSGLAYYREHFRKDQLLRKLTKFVFDEPG